MEKLELKHLYPYLPYDLKFEDGYILKGINFVEYGAKIQTENRQLLVKSESGWWQPNLDMMLKPVLRPLKPYFKMTLVEMCVSLKIDHNQGQELWKFIDNDISLENISFNLYLAMCRNHVDFNGLIDKGLAVDINTINKI